MGLYNGSLDNPFEFRFEDNGKDKLYRSISLYGDSSFVQPKGPEYIAKGIEAGCDLMLVSIEQYSPKYIEQDKQSERTERNMKAGIYEPTIGFNTAYVTWGKDGRDYRDTRRVLLMYRLVNGEWIHEPKIFNDDTKIDNPEDFATVADNGHVTVVASRYGPYSY